MSSRTERQPTTEWDFWRLVLLVGVPLAGGAVLYLLASEGDALALAILVSCGTVLLIGLGIKITLAIMDRQNEAEQIRFMRNMQENVQLVGQISKIQGAQAQSLAAQNSQLIKSLPDVSRINVKDLEQLTAGLVFDIDQEPAERRKW